MGRAGTHNRPQGRTAEVMLEIIPVGLTSKNAWKHAPLLHSGAGSPTVYIGLEDRCANLRIHGKELLMENAELRTAQLLELELSGENKVSLVPNNVGPHTTGPSRHGFIDMFLQGALQLPSIVFALNSIQLVAVLASVRQVNTIFALNQICT